VAGRLISLPTAPVRTGNRWLVPLDFITRALAPIYDARLDLRRASHLLVVGDLRVPRVSVRPEAFASAARVTIDIAPAGTAAVSQQGNQRLLVRIDGDALDVTIPAVTPNAFVQAIHTIDANAVAIDLGPRFSSFRSTIEPIDTGTRVVVDIVGAQTDTAPAPAPAPTTPPAPAEVPTRELTLNAGVRTVAIDAGHGGEDRGVAGSGGTLEKDVALSVARRVKAILEARLGLRVVMTREDDRDVPLENRTALANNNKADLFLSLHANASFRPTLSGATVYVASFSEADLANEALTGERLPVFGGGLREIEIVPWNLAQIPHREQSEQFAQAVAGSLSGKVPVSARSIEHAPLRVLESANMPAVLVEMGYLTNADQERALAGNDAQNNLAQALVDAIAKFRDATTSGAQEGAAP
jgi:N-acetylmuramoyl-L-alanine amidase